MVSVFSSISLPFSCKRTQSHLVAPPSTIAIIFLCNFLGTKIRNNFLILIKIHGESFFTQMN